MGLRYGSFVPESEFYYINFTCMSLSYVVSGTKLPIREMDMHVDITFVTSTSSVPKWFGIPTLIAHNGQTNDFMKMLLKQKS